VLYYTDTNKTGAIMTQALINLAIMFSPIFIMLLAIIIVEGV